MTEAKRNEIRNLVMNLQHYDCDTDKKSWEELEDDLAEALGLNGVPTVFDYSENGDIAEADEPAELKLFCDLESDDHTDDDLIARALDIAEDHAA